MKVEHAYKKDKSGNPLTHELSEALFSGLRPAIHAGRSYPNGGWVSKDKGSKAFTPPEVKEKPKRELPKGKVSATTSVKELITIIEEEGLDIDIQQPRGELIKQINEVRR